MRVNPGERTLYALLAYVSGLGFVITSGAFSSVNTVWLSGARHSGHSLRPSPVLQKFNFHDTGEHIAAHVLEHRVFGSACEKKQWHALLVILLTHLLVSAPSFMKTHCGINLVSLGIMLVLTGICPSPFLPKPEMLPALPRLGLAPLQPVLQTTSKDQHFWNGKLHL